VSTSKTFGSKAKKMWKSKPKARVGNSATGTGEWRAFRKAKVATPKKEKAPKKERR
jgi:hypothetical protein